MVDPASIRNLYYAPLGGARCCSFPRLPWRPPPPVPDDAPPCVIGEGLPAAPTASWGADDRDEPSLILVADPEADTWFEARFDLRFLDRASLWAAGPWEVPAGTSRLVPVSVPPDLMGHAAQAEVLTWIGATVIFSDAEGPLGFRHLTGGLTVEQNGVGFLTDFRSELVAPGGAYAPSAIAALEAAQIEEPGVTLEMTGGPTDAPVALSAEEVAP